MNRIVLIGNGFDLAHGLKTSYADFIYNFWERETKKFYQNMIGGICSFIPHPLFKKIQFSNDIIDDKNIKDIRSQFLAQKKGHEILQILTSTGALERATKILLSIISRNVEAKGWVDIEEEYYSLIKDHALSIIDKRVQKSNKNDEYIVSLDLSDFHQQFDALTVELIDYLKGVTQDISTNGVITDLLRKPILEKEIAISELSKYEDFKNSSLLLEDEDIRHKLINFGYTNATILGAIADKERYKEQFEIRKKNPYAFLGKFPEELLVPDYTILLNFNYTKVASQYINTDNPYIGINNIHGVLNDPSSVIFGYGDELDDNFKKIQGLNHNEYLKNIKSIKYLENNHYRELLSLMDSKPFQIVIMGHSCGTSDRTLLNTMFEHRNCVSIKPYYYKNGDKDNYLDIVQNISRSFTDMKLMRDRVVNKLYCSPLPQLDISRCHDEV